MKKTITITILLLMLPNIIKERRLKKTTDNKYSISNPKNIAL